MGRRTGQKEAGHRSLSVFTLIDTSNTSAQTTRSVIVSFKPFRPPRRATEPSDTFKRKVEHLDRLLSYPAGPDQGFRTLQCIGVVRYDISRSNKMIYQYGLVYDLPSQDGSIVDDFQNLSGAVTSKSEARPTLGERFRLSLSPAETIFNFLSVDWLHKSIRSNNVLLFRRATCLSFSEPYLVGFGFSRAEEDQSTVDYDDVLLNNLYRHPRRQGPPDVRFSILHDLYSLGVVLLEIGVWRPVSGFADFSQMTPDSIQVTLIEHATERLPHYIGKDFSDAVVACLNGSLAGFLTNDEQDLALSDESRARVLMAFWEGPCRLIEKGLAIL